MTHVGSPGPYGIVLLIGAANFNRPRLSSDKNDSIGLRAFVVG